MSFTSRRILPLIFLIFSLTATSSAFARYFTPAEVNALHNNPPIQKTSYGDNPSQIAELRLPAYKGLYPVVITLHGGCWLAKFADLKNTAALADALRDEGYTTWNIEYRSVDQEGGGWPGTFQDVAQATDYLKTIAAKYHLDLNRVIVVGHSAGGQLALWLAARRRLPTDSMLYVKNPLKIKGAVILGGVTDLAAFRPPAQNGCGIDIATQLLGAESPETLAARYQETSPIELLPLSVPQILIFGADDPAVSPASARAYVQAAQTKGDNAKLVLVKGAGHYEVVVPNSVTWLSVTAVVAGLLGK